jgi:hypothetical protein
MIDLPETADAHKPHPLFTNEEQRWKAVRAHIAKGDKAKDKAEQHYIAAGQYLKELKAEHGGTWGEWEALVKEKAGIGKSRASELMQIADGRKTVEQIVAATTDRSQKHRALSPLRNGENADNPETAAGTMKERFAALEVSDDGDSEEMCWRRGLLHRATESAGHALYEDWSHFTVDDEVFAAANAAAEAWSKTADYLQRLRDARSTPADDGIPEFLRREQKEAAS